MPGGVDALLVHVVDKACQPFAGHGPAHEGQVFGGNVGTVDIGRARAVMHDVGERGVPDIGGDVAKFLGCLGDERPEQAPVRITVDADPCGLAHAGEIAGARVTHGLFHVDECRPDAPCLRLSRSGAAGAQAGVEQGSRRVSGSIEAVAAAGGQNDALRPDDGEGRGLPGNVKSQRPGNAVPCAEQIDDHVVIEDVRPGLFRFTGEYGLLIIPFVFEKYAGTSGKGMPHEGPVAVDTHVDAPGMPELHDIKALFQKTAAQGDILTGAHHALVQFLHDDADVRPVLFRDVAEKVIVARSAGAAAEGVGLFRDQNADAGSAGGDGGGKACNAAAHDKHVGGKMLFDWNHGMLLLGLLELRGFNAQQHVIERNLKRNRSLRTVQPAGVAVPAFVGIANLGNGAFFPPEEKDRQGADVGALAAVDTFCFVYDRGHVRVLLQKRLLTGVSPFCDFFLKQM